MMIGILYWLLTLMCCGYVAVFGGKEGKWGALLFLFAAAGTLLAAFVDARWTVSNIPLFIVDGLQLATLYVLTLRSRHWWPVWSTGFQLLAVVAHLATFLDPGFLPALYRAMESVWAIPMLVSMVVGVHLDRVFEMTGRRRAGSARPDAS